MSSDFIGVKVEEDPHTFLNEMDKIFWVMRDTNVEGVNFTAYQLKKIAYLWYGEWDRDKGDVEEDIEDEKRRKADYRDRQGNKTGFLIRKVSVSRWLRWWEVAEKKCGSSSSFSTASAPFPQQSSNKSHHGGDNSRAQGASLSRSHRGFCEEGRDKCFKYGQVGHQLRGCPSNKVAMGVNKIPMASSSVPTPGGMASASVTAPGSSDG
ncbi:uncharacterized protein LOC124898507 [Capsicum annuum]|uniref:uncharacterized protein LOC124898507 n=1 Tax=Capsicum annuum TaxID=4072 RepID=UPI001FB11046|nr:uncharacterized protein LOC124898507 [Capsicum annuum]